MKGKKIDHYRAIGESILKAEYQVYEAIQHFRLLTNTGIGPTADEHLPLLKERIAELDTLLSSQPGGRQLKLVATAQATHFIAYGTDLTACGNPVQPSWKITRHWMTNGVLDVSDEITCKNCRRVCGI